MKYILGTKEKMTQIFDESGTVYPVTIVKADPVTVTQIKTLEKDGYDAIQVGSGSRKEKNIKKPQKPLGNFSEIREKRTSGDETEKMNIGDKLDVSSFEEGDNIRVSSVSKGKGFQGVVKRWNFAGGPRTHGNKHTERSGGSIGSKGVARVFKGVKMPGRMGGDKITVKNLKVVKVDSDSNTLYIRGAIPGRKGTLVTIEG